LAVSLPYAGRIDPIDALERRLPTPDGRWRPRAFAREELLQGLLDGKVAGRAAHPLDNVRGNIAALLEGDPDKRFGMTFVSDALGFDEVLELVERAAGSPIDRTATTGDVWIAPEPVLSSCEALGDRLGAAAADGASLVFATGHPGGLGLLYRETAALARAAGARVLRPADGRSWRDDRGGRRDVRYLGDVAVLTDGRSTLHTHAPDAMERILDDARPDLVVADHGFAGAAIEAGINVVSVADVNDPALIVARALGRGDAVVVMDDNVALEAYWPCFQAFASRLELPQPARRRSATAPGTSTTKASA
jgi:hypothetical protein